MTQCGLIEMPNFVLGQGTGDYDEGTACVMSAAVACQRLKNGEPLGYATDNMSCCCPIIRKFAICFNDAPLWKSPAHRTMVLLPFVTRLADTRDGDLILPRCYAIVDWLLHDALPALLKLDDDPEIRNVAEKLLTLPSAASSPTAAAELQDSLEELKTQNFSPAIRSASNCVRAMTILHVFAATYSEQFKQKVASNYFCREFEMCASYAVWAVERSHAPGYLKIDKLVDMFDKLIKMSESQTPVVVS